MGKDKLWGWLFAALADVPSVDLCGDVSVGRDDSCNVVVSSAKFPLVSKHHFTLGMTSHGPQLTDRSTNGTFMDGRKVGRNKTVPLTHCSKISIGGPERKYTAFVFMDKATCDTCNYIPEIKNKYAVAHHLGEGGFGEVFLVFNKKTHERFAMKVIQVSTFAKREAKILKELKHPCVIRTYEIIISPKELYFVLELMEGGDLSRWVNPSKLLSERQSKLIFYQLVLAVEYLHKNGIGHRDIKPANILLMSQEPETLIKVTDFGLSKNENQDSTMVTRAGTELYLAPEVMSSKPYTKQVDLWSMGVILFYSLSGSPPFLNIQEALQMKFQIMFTTDRWKGVSTSALELVKRLLVITPERRISIQEMLGSSWLQDETIRNQAHALMGISVTEETMSSAKMKSQSFIPDQRPLVQPRGVLQYGNRLGFNDNNQPVINNGNQPRARVIAQVAMHQKPTAPQYKIGQGNILNNPNQHTQVNQYKTNITNKPGQLNKPGVNQHKVVQREINKPAVGVNPYKPDQANRPKLLNMPIAGPNRYRLDQAKKLGQLERPKAAVHQHKEDQDGRLGLFNNLAKNQPKLERQRLEDFNKKPQPVKDEASPIVPAVSNRPRFVTHQAKKTFLVDARNQLKPVGSRNIK